MVTSPNPRAGDALLAAFINPRARANVTGHHWTDVLGRSVDGAVDDLVAAGLLVAPSLVNHLASAHSGARLKDLAKERGLPSSGRKEQVAARLVLADEVGMRAAVSEQPMLCCSERGRVIAQAYIDLEQSRKLAAEAESVSLLREGRFEDSARVVGRYEATQIHPRGIGIDWWRYPSAHDLEVLDAVKGPLPALLRSVSDRDALECRVGASMMALWGRKFDHRWCPDLANQVGNGIAAEVAVRMVLFSAQQRAQIANWRTAGITRVRVSIVGDDRTCAQCSALGGPFTIESAPELPHPHCNSPIGCRCMYMPDAG